MDFLMVGIGGFFGSMSRYVFWLLEKKYNPTFPYATLFINTLGCFFAGFFYGWIIKMMPGYRQILLFGSIGFLGSFTTFSAFSLETVQLIRSEQIFLGVINIFMSIILGLLAIWLGIKIAN